MEKVIRVSAPGKIIVFGEHAVVYGKQALAASLDLRTELTIRNNEDDIINLNLPSIGLNLSWPLQQIIKLSISPINRFCACEDVEDLKKVGGESAKFLDEGSTKLLAVVAFLHLFRSLVLPKFVQKMKGMNIEVTSLIPTGTGLGSSAAYSVCLAAGFLVYSDTVETNSNCFAGFSKEDLDLINGWAFVAEKIIHGKPSGIDNSVSTFGRAMWFKDGVFSLAENMPNLNVLLINSKISRNTKTLVEKVRLKRDKYPQIFDPIFDSIDGVTSVFKQMLITNDPDQFYINLTELISLNEQLLELLGVGHESIGWICDVLTAHGLRGKLTGAGGGGCVFTVIPPHYDEGNLFKLKEELDKLNFECFVTSLGGQGVHYYL